MADEKKAEVVVENLERTLAMIKPDAVAAGKADEIIERIKKEGFTVIECQKRQLSVKLASEFYAEHKGKKFFDELVAFMCSGPSFQLILQKDNAIKSWRTLMGPTNFEVAKKESPNSIRALYGSSMTKNASHGSDSPASSFREREFFFPSQYTLALIKPDAVANGNAPAILNRIVAEGFRIVEQQKLELAKERAEAFYAEHKGKGFFDELVGFMTSGPIYALKLARFNAMRTWRNLMGPTNFKVAQKEAPNSIRALYGSSMTKNASHGSDAIASAYRETEFFFPSQRTLALIKPDAVSAGNADAIEGLIRLNGFDVVSRRQLLLTKERAEEFYAEHKERGFFGELVDFMISGPIVALELRRCNAIVQWRTLMGPTKNAKQDAPNSVRALYGTDLTKNASHGSDSEASAKRELNFFFPSQNTLALIKPHAVRDNLDSEIIATIQFAGFEIEKKLRLKLEKKRASEFYAEHEGRPFFNELVDMMSSGEIIALQLRKFNAIKAWRSLMGPTRKNEAEKDAPFSIRALYAIDTTNNASHGSDSEASAVRELKFFFDAK